MRLTGTLAVSTMRQCLPQTRPGLELTGAINAILLIAHLKSKCKVTSMMRTNSCMIKGWRVIC